MNFEPTPLSGAFLVRPEPRQDERGFFARIWCSEEFAAEGINKRPVQTNLSHSVKKGTLRGMHWQAEPDAECKLIQCTRGSLFDVIVDVRPQSPTYLQWYGALLDAASRTMMFVPEGFAHGFVTLEDHTDAVYHVTAPYSPGSERCGRWDDPNIGIDWPIQPVHMSEKDANAPGFPQ